MNDSLVDLQLKQLTQLCLATRNFDKLGRITMILISNRLDEIGIRLGIKPRNKQQEETMAAYMENINSVLEGNFRVKLFVDELIQELRYNEAVLMRRKAPLKDKHVELLRSTVCCY
ncbi:MAG: hypothetical protein EU548_03335, partial [Promethearchaeota archaeon]